MPNKSPPDPAQPGPRWFRSFPWIGADSAYLLGESCRTRIPHRSRARPTRRPMPSRRWTWGRWTTRRCSRRSMRSACWRPSPTPASSACTRPSSVSGLFAFPPIPCHDIQTGRGNRRTWIARGGEGRVVEIPSKLANPHESVFGRFLTCHLAHSVCRGGWDIPHIVYIQLYTPPDRF